MFVMPTQLKFASEETPAVLRACFDAFVAALPEGTADREPRAELLWAALHGISALSATGRIPAEFENTRLDLLVDGIAPSRQGLPRHHASPAKPQVRRDRPMRART
jgi:hypothetical protein